MPDKNLELAVEIMKTSLESHHSWITRFFVVQGALATALGAVLAFQGNNAKLVTPAVVVICLVGLGASIVLAGVIIRALSWHKGHTERVKALQQPGRELYVAGMVKRGLRLETGMYWISGITCFAWIAAAFIFGMTR